MLNVADRRERLVRILILRGHATLSQLSAELGVTERTIMRDVDALSISTPIFTIVGRYGGIYIDKSYIKNQPKLKDCEIALLEKIAQDIEKTSFCSLNYNELKLLQEIINTYSNKRLKSKM